MSGSDLRPLSYGWVDKNNANSYALTPELPEATNGYNDGQIPPAKKYNHTMQRHAGWIAHLDAVSMRSDQLCGDTSVSRLSQYGFRFLTGAGLSQSVPDNSTYIIDGFIVDLALTRLGIEGYTPFLFTASKWTHWYISKDGVSFTVVNIGVAASPPGGSYHLGTVVTNGIDVTSWVAGNSIFNDRTVNFAPNVSVAGMFTVESTMEVNDSTVLNGDLTVNNVSVFNGVSEWSVNSGSPAMIISNAGTGGGIFYTSNSNGPAAMIELAKGNGSDGTLIKLTAVGAGPSICLQAIGGDGDTAIDITAGAGQAGLVVQGASTGTYAARFKGGMGQTYVAYFEAGAGGVGGDAGGALFTGVGLGSGIGVSGGTSAGAYAGQFLARNSAAQGAVFAQTHTTATTASRAGYFQGRDSAAGLEAVSAGYYPLILTPDTTSPTYGHILAAAQDAAPTQPSSGSMAYVAGVINGWGQGNATDGAFRWFWSSKGGYVYGGAYNQTVTSTSAASYSTLATVTLTSGTANAIKVAGESIVITASVRFRVNSVGATGVDMRVMDSVTGTAVFEHAATGTAITNGYYLAGATTDWGACFTVEREWVVSSTATRTFTLEIRRWGATPVFGHGSLKIRAV